MEFIRRTVAPTKDNENYYSNKNIFYACGYGMANCTCYVQGRWLELSGEDTKCRHNAGGWIEEARKSGKKIGTKPALGAIVVWKIPNTDSDGHVAVVEAIKSNGDIICSNSAYKGTEWYEQTFKASSAYGWTSSKTGKKYVFQGFILPSKPFTEVKNFLTVTGSLYLRERPDKNSKSIIVMHKGDSFLYDGQFENVNGTKWLHGQHVLTGKVGWASSKYIK